MQAIRQETKHQVICGDSRRLAGVASDSVQLVVTSPPYPMIEMWDEQFARMNPAVGTALGNDDAYGAYELMHGELDRVWTEVVRVVEPGGFVCINIGDATRTVAGRFRMFPNHSRIVQACTSLGLDMMPGILWHKPTNSPNKFMGSGMLPAGAYMTLEHEHILIFRKAGKRLFVSAEDKLKRRASAFFWEERNQWFSDVWDLKGVLQKMVDGLVRARSAAYPFELPWRLINMFSLACDTVLDPFLGTGTTSVAAAVCARHSIGFDLEPTLLSDFGLSLAQCVDMCEARNNVRLLDHLAFVNERERRGKPLKYKNANYGFSVMTKQEEDLQLLKADGVQTLEENASYVVRHSPFNMSTLFL